MFDRGSEFFKLSKGVVEQFLQSAVIVDDGAAFERGPGDKPSTKLITPSRRFRKQSDLQSQERDAAGETEITGRNSDVGRLDAKKVIDSFAQRGIVCSVLLPHKEEMEALTGTLEKMANCADIIILDWSLYKDQGEKALEMIERIVRSSTGSPAQLRLIVIYTINPRIEEISQKVKAVLDKLGEAHAKGNGKAAVQVETDKLSLTFGAIRITVLAKHDAFIPDQYRHQVVSFEDLADRVTEEFTTMTAGLVSNVVLKSLAQVRENTYRILSQFSSDLDAPYLTHRALLLNPDDAEELLTALVAEELQAILEEACVGSEANLNAIRAWVAARQEAGTSFALKLNLGDSEPTTIAVEKVVDLLRIGIQNGAWTLDGLNIKKRRSAHKLPLTEMFQPVHHSPQSLDEKFAFITTMRACYRQYIPRLTLGTILKESGDASSYWVCIQPRCDCIRIKSARRFPFLPLEKAGEGRFNIVLNEGDIYLRLLCSEKPYDLKLIAFEQGSQGSGIITAEEEGGIYCFYDTSKNKYEWMGQLRPDHAQRLSNRFAATLARVGLDESEWLRLWAK